MSFIGMDSAGGYTTQSMAAAAARHYGQATNRGVDDGMRIIESLCGLLAMQLARYADEPHDDFDDDCPHCDSDPCRCAEIVTVEAGNG